MSSFAKGLTASFAVLVLALGLAVLPALTIHRLAAAPASLTSWSDEGKAGTATVTACATRGPIGLGGVGYYWVCTADVVTQAGARTGMEFEGEFTPDDQGKPVAVMEDDGEWKRNVAHPYWFLEYVLGAYLFIFLFIAVIVAGTVYQEFKKEDPDESVAETSKESVDLPVRHHEAHETNPNWGKVGAGLGSILAALGIFTGWLVFESRVGGFWDPAYLVAGTFLVVGAVIVYCSLRRTESLKEATFFVETEGLRVLTDDGEGRLLAWSSLERIVFDQPRAARFRDVVSVLLIPTPSKRDGLHAWIRTYFRGGGTNLGYELSPGTRRATARKFSNLIERQQPGLTRWPQGEIRRWGFGLFGLVDRFRRAKQQ
ncbi:hypothetical protein DMH03_04615 [Amycolatopsis sp. WAC 01376]|uniref:DUF6346 domain-containing protein n=1 Tax=Amycolatopsis sp. WAC 01376 TaxID=2203195 RepID=UPI000F7B7C3C|nr:DUF6346 domain-containing protein [Amycolatopsis sp. WAC 01376]RSM66398.1 hypothetical protein DMH03_04615 [Amycolatopsis sp. WAC 01376]